MEGSALAKNVNGAASRTLLRTSAICCLIEASPNKNGTQLTLVETADEIVQE
jgi:hypothetical protein